MNSAGEVLIIGGGIIGLAIALELRLRGAVVTVLSRDFAEAATQAAAGMLAPQAEALPPGPMLDLCLRSRSLYPHWTSKIEELTGLSTGYWPCGILAPVYESSLELAHSHPPSLPDAPYEWLDQAAIHHHQPGLGAEVMGGWWFPQDAQVDNRALVRALRTAVTKLGVTVEEGVSVTTIQQQEGRVLGVRSPSGSWQADHYVLATGAWGKDLLPVPVYPKKGQMLSVQIPPILIQRAAEGQQLPNLPLKQVLFGSNSYIVPRQDGRIVIGATSEDVGFTPANTPTGVQALLHQAIRLYPVLQDFPIQELWWGFRPATPDQSPILGESPYENLTLATGHYRNGILLAPVTALLIANWILHRSS
ncbi:MAG: glycine oxidase ThiO, partial [Leptolyngbyaceae bacterium]|nr:glycine oxidase ThiO [Leptolyngbyaceae bacterium]